ncbi:MAG: ABC transporter permease [Dehalococcoidia bacterium]|nr:MAG: ABC transporter permease [Dehalococcoidia bacterium]
MRVYIIKRLLLMIPILIVVTFLIFFLTYLLPGDIIDAMQGYAQDIALDRAALERELGLDAPIFVQYGRWMGVVPQMDGNFSGVFQGNLGMSYWRREPVLKLVAQRWPVTLQLGVMGLMIGQLIALPIGVFSALRQDKWGDYIGRSFAILCISIPGFWVGTMIIVFPAIWWGHMPPVMLIRLTDDPIGNLRMFVVPAIVLGLAFSGATMRITRTQVLQVLREDYIRTAWAKGLKERVVVTRHILKNALIPVITAIGLQVPALIGGTVIIEKIFCLPGMGRLIFDAILQRDKLLVCGVVLFFSVGLVVINLMVDLTYALLDPRIRYR